jgi:uncharacterized phage protein gp47/JayE
MAGIEYGYTPNGFLAKPYEILLQEERDAFQLAFGYDIDLDDDSIEGVYIKNQALKMTQLWEQLAKLYAATDVDDAFGVYLDRLVNLVNVTRLAPQPTVVYEALWCEPDTFIPKGHLLRQGKEGMLFASQAAVTANMDAELLGFILKVDTVEWNHNYILQIGEKTVVYEAVDPDDALAVQAGLMNAIETADPGAYEMTNDADGLAVYLKKGDEGFLVNCTDARVIFPQFAVFSKYSAKEAGPTIAVAHDVETIVNPINGLKSATNYAQGLTGRTGESDTELRQNMYIRQRNAKANEVAIANAILMLQGVSFARVHSNRSMEVDAEGRPPKSYEACVVGGNEQEIAETIFDNAPAGIQAYGQIIKTVLDDEGFEHEVGFSRPAEVYIWLKIAWRRNTEEQISPAVAAEMQAEIMQWAVPNTDVGEDLIVQKMFKPVYEVNGIGFADIKAAKTYDLTPPAAEDYTADNIAIGQVEKAFIDPSRMEITELTA